MFDKTLSIPVPHNSAIGSVGNTSSGDRDTNTNTSTNTSGTSEDVVAVPLVPLDKESLLNELRAANERLLAEQRQQLESEFDRRFELLLSTLQNQNQHQSQKAPQLQPLQHRQQQQQSTVRTSTGKIVHPVATAQQLDNANAAFAQAAQQPQTAPQIRLFEGNKQTATIRANAQTADVPLRLRTSNPTTAGARASNPNVSQDESLDNNAADVAGESPLSLHRHSNGVKGKTKLNVKGAEKVYPAQFMAYAPTSSHGHNSKPGVTSSKQVGRSEGDDGSHAADGTATATTSYAPSEDFDVDSEYRRVEAQLGFVTRFVVRKSEGLIKQAADTIALGNDGEDYTLSGRAGKRRKAKGKSKGQGRRKDNVQTRPNQSPENDESYGLFEIDETDELGDFPDDFFDGQFAPPSTASNRLGTASDPFDPSSSGSRARLASSQSHSRSASRAASRSMSESSSSNQHRVGRVVSLSQSAPNISDAGGNGSANGVKVYDTNGDTNFEASYPSRLNSSDSAVATSGSSPTLPAEWLSQRVNVLDKRMTALSQPEWENEIAKHILSMFVTVNADPEDLMKASKAVLEFADLHGRESRDGVREYVGRRPIHTPLDPEFAKPSLHMTVDEQQFDADSGILAQSNVGRNTTLGPYPTNHDVNPNQIPPLRTLSSVRFAEELKEECEEEIKLEKDAKTEEMMCDPNVKPIKRGKRKNGRLKHRDSKSDGLGEGGVSDYGDDTLVLPDIGGATGSPSRKSSTQPAAVSRTNTGTSTSSSRGTSSNPNSRKGARRNLASLTLARSNSNSANQTQRPSILGLSRSPGDIDTDIGPSDPNAPVLAQAERLESEEHFERVNKLRSTTLKTRDGENVTFRSTAKVFPVWFVSSGDVYSDWSALPGGERFQAQLSEMYERKHYKEYLQVLEATISELWRVQLYGEMDYDAFMNHRRSIRPRVPQLSASARQQTRRHPSQSDTKHDKNESSFWPTLDRSTLKDSDGKDHRDMGTRLGTDLGDPEQTNTDYRYSDSNNTGTDLSLDALRSLWRQLIVTGNAIGVLCVEKNRFEDAMDILRQAEEWTQRDAFLPVKLRHELRAFVNNAMAFYFFKRGRYTAALNHTMVAKEWHEKADNLDGVSICLLHIAACQIQTVQFKEAHKTIYLFLAMVDDGRMSFEKATPMQLCMIAIAYHNLAVVQLKMDVPDLACKSSQNARKIARLCLSFSNRWIKVFQRTHETAIDDVKFLLQTKGFLEDSILRIVQGLVDELYDPRSI